MNRSFYYMNPMRRGKLYRFFLLLGAVSSLFLLTGVLNTLSLSRNAQEALSEDVAPQVLRFHVLANSDSREDQELKLEVRRLLLDSIYDGISHEMDGRGILSKQELQSYISGHSRKLEQEAEAYMRSKGYPYTAEIRLEQCYFPTKQYGDVSFPCGTYDAVRVLLGEGKGKNWWCVLYPPLCFSGVTSAGEMPDESKQELKNLLPEEDYLPLMTKRRIVFGEKIRAGNACLPGAEGAAANADPSRTGKNAANGDGTTEQSSGGVTVQVKFKLWEMVSKQQ